MSNPTGHSIVTGFQKTSDGAPHQAQLDDDLNLKVAIVASTGGGLTDAELRASPVVMELTDGTNVAAINPPFTPPSGAEPTLVVAVSPNSDVSVVLNGVNNGGVVVGTGASTLHTPRVTVANDSSLTLVAGSAIIGQVGIDQTTPGVSNAVSLSAGSAVIGHVITDAGSTVEVATTDGSYASGTALNNGSLHFVTIGTGPGTPRTSPVLGPWTFVHVTSSNNTATATFVVTLSYLSGISDANSMTVGYNADTGKFLLGSTAIKAVVDAQLLNGEARMWINTSAGVAFLTISIQSVTGTNDVHLQNSGSYGCGPVHVTRAGSKGATAVSEITSTANGADHQALDVQIYDGAGAAVSPLTNAQLRLTAVPMTGVVTAGGPAASGAAKALNPLQIGGVFNTTQPTVTNGSMVEAQSTARGAQIVATGVDGFPVTIAAGSAVIGHVITDTGSITAVTGTVAVSGPLTDTQLRATAVPVSGTVTTTPPANASTNLAQIVGTTADVNSGSKSAGTLRVVLATDQPALTNKLLVTPDSVALPANQSVNISQVNGVMTLTGTGATGTGAQRVTVSVDSATVAGSASLPAGSNVIGHVIADTGSTTAVTGTVAVTNAGLTNLDVALSTRTKPSDQQHTIIDSSASIAVTGPATDTQLRATPLPVSGTIAVTNAGLTNLDVALSTRLKPADTLAAVTSITNAVTVAQATPANLNATVTPITLTKGTQGTTGFSVQHLHDAGRNTRIFMLDTITVAPVAEALATVVQWYGNAAVAGTTTPAVIPAGKTLRLTGYKIQYQSLATVGYAVVRIRFNTASTVLLASPLVASFESGSGSGATTAAMTGGVTVETGSFPEGLELPAGGGIGFSVAGYGPTGALTLEGGVRFEVHGYEY